MMPENRDGPGFRDESLTMKKASFFDRGTKFCPVRYPYTQTRSGTNIENMTILTSDDDFLHANENTYRGLITKKKLYGKAYTRTNSQICYLIKNCEHHHKKQQNNILHLCLHTHKKK